MPDPDFEVTSDMIEDEAEGPAERVNNMLSNKGDMNREFIKDLVYFFNLYLGNVSILSTLFLLYITKSST